ncbi:MAG: hypothetical protein ACRDPY_28310 [Streptosporangiaceae bacterium]
MDAADQAADSLTAAPPRKPMAAENRPRRFSACTEASVSVPVITLWSLARITLKPPQDLCVQRAAIALRRRLQPFMQLIGKAQGNLLHHGMSIASQ